CGPFQKLCAGPHRSHGCKLVDGHLFGGNCAQRCHQRDGRIATATLLNRWLASSCHKIESRFSATFFRGAQLESSFLICFTFSQFLRRICASFPQSGRGVRNRGSPAQYLPTDLIRRQCQIGREHSGDRENDYPTESNPSENIHLSLRGERRHVPRTLLNNVAASIALKACAYSNASDYRTPP